MTLSRKLKQQTAVKLEPFTTESIFEENRDAVKEWLCEDKINSVANIQISTPRGDVYDEDGAWDQQATLVAHWEDVAYELIAQNLLSWEQLKEFYRSNQRIIAESFLPTSAYQRLYAAMSDSHQTESVVVYMSAFALYHWCFGYCYRAKRLALQNEKEMVDAKEESSS